MTPFPAGKFKAILADPPWSFAAWSEKGHSRSAENHYPTMDINELSEMPVGGLYEDECVLFLWVTWPRLEEGLRLIKRWGFVYKTDAFCWIKTTKAGTPALGTGYWTRANSEVCLLATHGRPKRLSASVSQVILAPRGRHSAKPAEARARIEKLVAGPYIELFARERAPGWVSWGNEL